jgi:hypothetical protein
METADRSAREVRAARLAVIRAVLRDQGLTYRAIERASGHAVSSVSAAMRGSYPLPGCCELPPWLVRTLNTHGVLAEADRRIAEEARHDQ